MTAQVPDDRARLTEETARKRRFYSGADTAHRYYRSAGTAAWFDFVTQQERSIVDAFLPPGDGQLALDVATGNGRLAGLLREHGYRVIGLDISAAMLRQAPEYTRSVAVADAQALPIASGSVAGILCHRFLYHYSTIGPFLREFRRVLVPGGWLCFDTVLWTPSTVARLVRPASPRLVHSHRPGRIVTELARAG